MKRDMDLVRQVLIVIEESDNPNGPPDIEIEPFTKEQVNYHIGLLYNAGLIEAFVMNVARGKQYIPQNLTWGGHEFLDAARNENVWNSTKEAIKEYGGSVPLEIVKALLIKTAGSYLGL